MRDVIAGRTAWLAFWGLNWLPCVAPGGDVTETQLTRPWSPVTLCVPKLAHDEYSQSYQAAAKRTKLLSLVGRFILSNPVYGVWLKIVILSGQTAVISADKTLALKCLWRPPI